MSDPALKAGELLAYFIHNGSLNSDCLWIRRENSMKTKGRTRVSVNDELIQNEAIEEGVYCRGRNIRRASIDVMAAWNTHRKGRAREHLK
jgi:hypothetical protein